LSNAKSEEEYGTQATGQTILVETMEQKNLKTEEKKNQH